MIRKAVNMIPAFVVVPTIDLAGSAHDSASVASLSIDLAGGANDFSIGGGIGD